MRRKLQLDYDTNIKDLTPPCSLVRALGNNSKGKRKMQGERLDPMVPMTLWFPAVLNRRPGYIDEFITPNALALD